MVYSKVIFHHLSLCCRSSISSHVHHIHSTYATGTNWTAQDPRMEVILTQVTKHDQILDFVLDECD